MSKTPAKLYIGAKIRRLRRELGLSQARMAEDLGVSPSYANLIERNLRPVSAGLLVRIAQNYDLDLKRLTADDHERYVVELEETLADPMFSRFGVTREDIHELAAAQPIIAEAMATLYRAYRNRGDARGGGEKNDAESDDRPAQAPLEQVRDLIQSRGNYFADLDEAGEALHDDLVGAGEDLFVALSRRLRERHRLRVRVLPVDLMGDTLRRFDRHGRRLLLSEALGASSRIFQIALQLALIERSGAIDAAIAGGGLQSEDAVHLARMSLANYTAAATLMPYDAFLRAAEELDYDIEILGRRFGVNFEQTCHRLTTLQRPGRHGVPFFFIRVDVAGNISKRLSGAGFAFSRYGGACPRWNLHQTFRSPHAILTDIIRLPGGAAYFSIARAVRGDPRRFGDPVSERAIGLGCDIAHAGKLVYSRGIDLDDPDNATDIGVTCRLCDRADCLQRAHPPSRHRLLIDENRRSAAPYAFTPVWDDKKAAGGS